MSPVTNAALDDHKGGLRRLTKCVNGRLFYSCALIALSQVNFGMDQGAFNGTQAMDSFTRKFGEYNPTTDKYAIPGWFLSLLNSLNYIGFGFGLVTGSAINARWGRRMTMFTMCIWAFISAILLVTAQHKEQVLAGRIIAYIYIGNELAVVPVLQSELTPAPIRGFVVGTYQSGLLIGQLIQALICRGTADIADDRAWRIPFGLFFIIPSIIAAGVWYMPESPRYLAIKGRTDEALASLRLLREGKFTDEEIEWEFRELQESINNQPEKGRFMEIFQGVQLKRTLISVGVNVFLQLTGQNFVSVYGTIFLKSLGTINPFTLTTVNTAINIVMVLVTQLLTDITGRVPLLIAGAAVQTGALFTMGGLGTVSNPDFQIRTGIATMVTIFGVGFQLGWAPLSHVVAAEIPTTRLRDVTYAFGAVFNIAIQFAVSFSIPYLINKEYAGLGSKVGFIFGSTAFLAILFSYFCVPECGGKTLEEIDQLFVDKTPIRKFGKTRAAVIANDDNESKAIQVEQKS